jgi:hypothetical protein
MYYYYVCLKGERLSPGKKKKLTLLAILHIIYITNHKPKKSLTIDPPCNVLVNYYYFYYVVS